jgi:hypothetical protein
VKDVGAFTIRSGKSLGCWRCASRGQNLLKHGKRQTAVYAVWKAIKSRCRNAQSKSYPDYGGRGVRLCQGWSAFGNFFADMGDRPAPGRQIDRQDNNGHYSCGHCVECVANGWRMNCRWATPKEQQRNRRNNRLVTADGRTMTLAAWTEETGVSSSLFCFRTRKGWDEERAILTPPLRRGKRPGA